MKLSSLYLICKATFKLENDWIFISHKARCFSSSYLMVQSNWPFTEGLFLMALLNDYYLMVMKKFRICCAVLLLQHAMKRGIFDNGNEENNHNFDDDCWLMSKLKRVLHHRPYVVDIFEVHLSVWDSHFDRNRNKIGPYHLLEKFFSFS